MTPTRVQGNCFNVPIYVPAVLLYGLPLPRIKTKTRSYLYIPEGQLTPVPAAGVTNAASIGSMRSAPAKRPRRAAKRQNQKQRRSVKEHSLTAKVTIAILGWLFICTARACWVLPSGHERVFRIRLQARLQFSQICASCARALLVMQMRMISSRLDLCVT